MRRRTLLAAPVLLLGGCNRGKTPAGQPPLRTLTVEAFQDAFNQDADKTRVVALLSPT
jgi:hypothetical protein